MKSKNQKISKSDIYKHASELSRKTIKDYMRYALPIFALELGIIISTLLLSEKIGLYISIVIIIINLLITTIFLVIFDGIPARRIKKSNYMMQGTKMTKDQGLVFYNALKLRTIYRGGFNIIATVITLILSVLLIMYA